MTAKQYLTEIEMLDNKINMRIEQLADYKSKSTSVSCHNEGDRVQASGAGDRIGDIIVKIITYENEIDDLIDEYVDKKNLIIQQLEKMSNVNHMRLLHMRYIKFKTFERIALDMHISARHTYRMHDNALKDFQNIIDDVIECHGESLV